MSDPDPLDTAWRIHAAVVDWTGKVDTKASYTLTIETAVMAGVIALSSSGRALAVLEGWRQIIYVVAVSLLGVAILCAAGVVFPRLRRRRKLRAEASTNFIYFGHLKHSSPRTILTQLQRPDALLPALANQLHQMSKIAWIKHRLVQISMTLAISSIICVVVAAFWLR